MTVRILVNDALEKIASFCLNLVKLLWNKSVSVDTGYLQSIVTAIAQQKQLQQKTIADHAEDYPALVVIEQIISTLETIIIQLDSTASTVIQIKNNQSINRIPKDKILSAESELLSGSKTPSWFDSLRDNFTFDSSFFVTDSG